MRYLHPSGEMRSDQLFASAATHGRSCHGTRQIVAARTFIDRFIHRLTGGNNTAASHSRKIICR